MTTTVIVSGGNRGLGLGLIQAYAARPNHTVISACRDPSKMPEVTTASGSKVIAVKVDATQNDDAKAAVEELKSKYGVTKIDLGIANAATMTEDVNAKIRDLNPVSFETHWRTNVLGAVTFYQAVVPLLPAGGKFVFMSSGASIIDRVPDKYDVSYGITKSADNYLARYAHFEEPELVIFSMSPGWVQTDMGNVAARAVGLEKAPTTVEESVSGMVKVIDDATRDNYSGLHMRYTGVQSKW